MYEYTHGTHKGEREFSKIISHSNCAFCTRSPLRNRKDDPDILAHACPWPRSRSQGSRPERGGFPGTSSRFPFQEREAVKPHLASCAQIDSPVHWITIVPFYTADVIRKLGISITI